MRDLTYYNFPGTAVPATEVFGDSTTLDRAVAEVIPILDDVETNIVTQGRYDTAAAILMFAAPVILGAKFREMADVAERAESDCIWGHRELRDLANQFYPKGP